MRIGLISTLSTRVAAEHSGSIEFLVWLLAQEFSRSGHHVTVFGAEESELGRMPNVELIATLASGYTGKGSPTDWQLCEWINICKAIEHSPRLDVLHCNAYLWSVPLARLSRCPMVHTSHVMPNLDQDNLRDVYPDAFITAISNFQWSGVAGRRAPRAVIHHGTDPGRFRYHPEPRRADGQEYLAYLGRIIPGKGVLDAIEAARQFGIPLRIAGPSSRYYETEVVAHVDGQTVQFLGPVTGQARLDHLGGASVLIYPNVTPEPFGLVMIEAMMCGTPVVATNVGAVPEIVDEGVTGYIASSLEDLPEKIGLARKLDRSRVRQTAVRRFSASRMAGDYLRLYQSIIHNG